MNPEEATEIGRRLKDFCGTVSSYRLLDGSSARGGTWTAGGCLILAHAMHVMLSAKGEKTKVAILKNKVPQHAVCVVRLSNGADAFFDGDGISRRDGLLRRWLEEEDVAPPLSIVFPRRYPDVMPVPGGEQEALKKRLASIFNPRRRK